MCMYVSIQVYTEKQVQSMQNVKSCLLLHLNFICFAIKTRCTMTENQSSLIWEHGAVTTEHNDTTHTQKTHTHNPTSGKQERSSCELHSSVQIEGDTGRLVNRHRCTELSNT